MYVIIISVSYRVSVTTVLSVTLGAYLDRF